MKGVCVRMTHYLLLISFADDPYLVIYIYTYIRMRVYVSVGKRYGGILLFYVSLELVVIVAVAMAMDVHVEMHIIGKHPIIIVIISLGSINLFGFSMTIQFKSASFCSISTGLSCVAGWLSS